MLLMRLWDLEMYNRREGHTRMAHGIGALLLSHFLAEPEKWPSIHFPPTVPKEKIELNTIMYVYEHIDANWTLAEDRALRELVRQYVRRHGESVLRRKGEVPLANKLTYRLMFVDDRPHQAKRDQWVKEELAKLIKSGDFDTAQAGLFTECA